LKGKQGLFIGKVHIRDQVLVLFGVGLLAVGAAEALKSIPMDSEALTADIARRASHCCNGS
jgi:hypothetical protein